MNITLPVELLPGSEISKAIKEASELAEKLGIAYVNFNFNRCSVSVAPHADVEQGVIDYQSRVSQINSYVIVKAISNQ